MLNVGCRFMVESFIVHLKYTSGECLKRSQALTMHNDIWQSGFQNTVVDIKHLRPDASLACKLAHKVSEHIRKKYELDRGFFGFDALDSPFLCVLEYTTNRMPYIFPSLKKQIKESWENYKNIDDTDWINEWEGYITRWCRKIAADKDVYKKWFTMKCDIEHVPEIKEEDAPNTIYVRQYSDWSRLSTSIHAFMEAIKRKHWVRVQAGNWEDEAPYNAPKICENKKWKSIKKRCFLACKYFMLNTKPLNQEPTDLTNSGMFVMSYLLSFVDVMRALRGKQATIKDIITFVFKRIMNPDVRKMIKGNIDRHSDDAYFFNFDWRDVLGPRWTGNNRSLNSQQVYVL